ncbi:hypothetical protein [Desulfobacter sp. UBA2225]|uniref:hypothetical protein n=1 Tax=Desulfobacter sp. UBA2225 TaxID=1961413 RepID=UPI00257E4F5A|nr:hypothetical protein [Desulfobacter sp. UBA2225]
MPKESLCAISFTAFYFDFSCDAHIVARFDLYDTKDKGKHMLKIYRGNLKQIYNNPKQKEPGWWP